MTPLLPDPSAFGLPYAAWRPGQPEAVLHAIDDARRFQGLVLPTGFGKSLTYMAIARLTGLSTVILTSTRALQAQLMRDFGRIEGTTILQGQRAYRCKALEPGGELHREFGGDRAASVDAAPCHIGVECSLKAHGCEYFDALRKAGRSPVVVTNYAWWLTNYTIPILPLKPDLLVLDEAHDAPDALASAIGCELTRDEISEVLRVTLPDAGSLDGDGWIGWARAHRSDLQTRLSGTKPRTRSAVIFLRKAQRVLYALQRFGAIDPRLLVVSPLESLEQGIKVDIVWAAQLAETWLFRGAPRVVLTSATMTKKTADLVGILPRDLGFYEAGDGFPVARRPVYVAPAKHGHFGEPLRVDHRMGPHDEIAWVDHMDAILASRADRKGIIHSISYKHRDTILHRSRLSARMMTHGRKDAQEQIALFKQSPPGTVLVSPALTTGYDFPFHQAEFQIIAKVPFPDRRNPIIKARTIADDRYPAHLAMQQLVQMVGRAMRAADDRCETFVVDDHARWFLSKHADLSPRWFRRAVARLEPGEVPAPPPALPPVSDTPAGD